MLSLRFWFWFILYLRFLKLSLVCERDTESLTDCLVFDFSVIASVMIELLEEPYSGSIVCRVWSSLILIEATLSLFAIGEPLGCWNYIKVPALLIESLFHFEVFWEFNKKSKSCSSKSPFYIFMFDSFCLESFN